MLHIIWYIIIGFIAGAIANFIMHTHMTFVMTTILGIVGSIVGGLIARLFSRPAQGASFHPAGLILSIIGALIVLYVSGKLLHVHYGTFPDADTPTRRYADTLLPLLGIGPDSIAPTLQPPFFAAFRRRVCYAPR